MLTGAEAADALRTAFMDSGLAAPPIPHEVVPLLRTVGPWLWSTDEDPRCDHESALDRLVTGPSPALTVAHHGHGRNSWALHYQLRLGPVAIALQVPWGNAYDDPAAANEHVARRFGDVRAILTALAGASDARRSGRLLVVALTDHRGDWAAVTTADGSHERLHPEPGATVADAVVHWLSDPESAEAIAPHGP